MKYNIKHLSGGKVYYKDLTKKDSLSVMIYLTS